MVNVSELPGPAQAVWNEAYQTAVRTLRESGVDAVLVNTRARRAADTQVGLYWEWDEYRLKWQAKHSQPYTGKSVELVWDETKHPRWAVGTGVGPGGEGGGRFKPKVGGKVISGNKASEQKEKEAPEEAPKKKTRKTRKRKLTAVDKYFNEYVNFGGVAARRLDVIRDLREHSSFSEDEITKIIGFYKPITDKEVGGLIPFDYYIKHIRPKDKLKKKR